MTKYSIDGDKATECAFCGEVYYEPQDIPTEQYMKEGHLIMECEKVPSHVRDWFNGPPEERTSDFQEVEGRS